MKATIHIGEGTDVAVRETLLGQNIEVVERTVRAFLSDRLENSRFAGPADANGFAPPWRASGDHYGSFVPALEAGVSLSGNESQSLHSYHNSGLPSKALVQTHRQIRRGEHLQVELWAKVKHEPVQLTVELRSTNVRRAPYVTAPVHVSSSYWKRHVVDFIVPWDDDEAVFACQLHGRGYVWFDQIHMRPAGARILDEEFVRRIVDLGVPVLRFPGGCLATNYHWKHGTGPQHLRPSVFSPPNNRTINYEFGTDEYLDVCLAAGTLPHITFNLGSGTPDEAAEWASYIAGWYRDRNIEPPQAYFQIGNEEFAVQDMSHMTPAMYANAVREFAPAVRESYPGARIIALAHEFGSSLDEHARAPWRQAVLEAAHDTPIDVMAIHLYQGRWSDDDAQRQATVAQSVGKARTAVTSLIDDIAAAGLDCTVGITEWNYWLTASHFDGPPRFDRSGAVFYEHFDTQHCLFVAAMVQMFVDHSSSVELANFYTLVNAMGVLQRRGLDINETALADVFRLFRPAFPGTKLSVKINSPLLTDTEPCVHAAGVEQQNRSWLFVTNLHPTEAADLTIDGYFESPSEIALLAGESPTSDFGHAPSPLWETEGIRLPPLSVMRLQW